jgi:predicted nucleic acid-binding protein
MTATPLAVVDTSVHLSSEVFGKPGSPAKEVIARGFAGHFDFALSALLLAEIVRKLAETGVPPSVAAPYVANLMAVGQEHPDVDASEIECADPDDAFVVALARSCAAWCVVAQDNALVDHDAVPPMWPPPVFLGRLRDRRGEPEGTRFVADDRSP